MLIYDSRSQEYKTPFGAVTAGTEVTLHADCDEEGLTLVLYRDYEPWQRLPFAGNTLTFRIEEPQIYWYFFETAKGRYYRDIRTNRPVSGEEGATWQLTVFDPSFRTPEWFRGGVLYQIFPDRFACSGQPKTGVPEDRFFHRSAEEPPDSAEPEGRPACSDYFGGDLEGIRENLDRLTGLSVTGVYLNPVFEAHSNHRYNTADYKKLDPLLGTEEDLRQLLAVGKEKGIRFLLDGVFSHVGLDSVYMNRYHRYPEPGAWDDPESPCRSWFTFREDGSYRCWWNVPTLPEVDENAPSFREEIQTAVTLWQPMGTGGWRLDVADELPDAFLEWFRGTVKALNPDALILGEVWEDATTKQREGVRREYLLGHQLDSVMNYPWRTAILDWILEGDGLLFRERLESVCENYPAPSLHTLMNLLGTHDTPRLLTVLGLGKREPEAKGDIRLTPEQRETGLRREIPAAVLQFFLPGVPSVYYGDEEAMEGGYDPYCRGFFTSAHRDDRLYRLYVSLGAMRKEHSCFTDGSLQVLSADSRLVLLCRKNACETLLLAVNRSWEKVACPAEGEVLLSSGDCSGVLEPMGFCIQKIL